MLNRLVDLEQEDQKYNLQVKAVEPESYNLILVFPQWKPHWAIVPRVPLQSPEKIRQNLAKLGIYLS
jgi:hypothetical protein